MALEAGAQSSLTAFLPLLPFTSSVILVVLAGPQEAQGFLKGGGEHFPS